MKKRNCRALTQSLSLLLLVGCARVTPCHQNSGQSIDQLDVQQWISAPLRISKRVRLDASSEEVFDYIASAETLPEWMPGLESLSYDHSKSVSKDELDRGSQRTMMFGDQAEIEEIVHFDRPNVVAYQILEGVPVRNHLAIMAVEESDDGSYLTWSQYFDIKRTSVFGWLMPFMVRGFVKDAQESLIKEFRGVAVETCDGRSLKVRIF